jgi:DNA (cytosine-5)-methyltransferase 1
MKQQTFIAEANCVDIWDAQQPESMSQTLTGLDSDQGRKSAKLPFAAGFCAGAGSSAGSIGYQEECVPTLKAADGGNMVPAILCLNDQGGKRIDLSQNISGTLRADEHGHQPLVMATQQGGAEIGVGVCPAITAAAGTSGNNQPVLFENHGIDSRYTGPHDIAPTMSARYGTGGNNVPLVSGEPSSTADRHTMFSRQRSDVFQENDVTATQSARQYKDATDLVRQPCGQKAIHPKLIRRLTPLECERLQGYPDGWTDIPGASDSARYKALGNSVAIPCVTFVLRGIAFALRRAMEEQ